MFNDTNHFLDYMWKIYITVLMRTCSVQLFGISLSVNFYILRCHALRLSYTNENHYWNYYLPFKIVLLFFCILVSLSPSYASSAQCGPTQTQAHRNLPEDWFLSFLKTPESHSNHGRRASIILRLKFPPAWGDRGIKVRFNLILDKYCDIYCTPELLEKKTKFTGLPSNSHAGWLLHTGAQQRGIPPLLRRWTSASSVVYPPSTVSLGY